MPTDPLQLDHGPAPGDWLSAPPRALARLHRRRLARRAILVLADDLDGADTLRETFGAATGLRGDTLPVLSLDTPSDRTPTLVLGPVLDATLATEPDRWLPVLERRLAEAPEMTCVLAEEEIVGLSDVVDAVRDGTLLQGDGTLLQGIAAAPTPTDDDEPSQW